MKEILTAYLSEKDLSTETYVSLTGTYGLLFSFFVDGAISTVDIDHEGYIRYSVVDVETGAEATDTYSALQAMHDGLIPALQEMCAACANVLGSWYMLDEEPFEVVMGELGTRWAQNWKLSGYTCTFSSKHPVISNFPVQLPHHNAAD